MKTKMPVLIVAGCVFLAAGCGQQVVNEPTGRYQLVIARIQKQEGRWHGDKAPTEEKLFKIDTVTGKVWEYEFGEISVDEETAFDSSGWRERNMDAVDAHRAAEERAAAYRAKNRER